MSPEAQLEVPGAFQDQSGNLLVLSNVALRSTDGGATFTQVMNSGVAANDLTQVSGAAQNPTDGSIIVGNIDHSGGSSTLIVWGTRDYGAQFSRLTSTSNISTAYQVKIASIENRVVLAITTQGISGESNLFTMHSEDGGSTWSPLSCLSDATSAGAHPTYTIGSVNMTTDPNTCSIALAYSIVDGNAHKGVYLKEFH